MKKVYTLTEQDFAAVVIVCALGDTSLRSDILAHVKILSWAETMRDVLLKRCESVFGALDDGKLEELALLVKAEQEAINAG